MKRYSLWIVLIVFVLITGFCMPSRILEWQDQKRMDHMVTEVADEVLLTPRTDLTVLEKLQLMKKDTVISFPAEGKNYTEETILDKVDQELETLEDLGILLKTMTEPSVYDMNELEVLFFVDMDDSSRSMRCWSISGYNTEGSIYLLVDDDTGKILTIYQYMESDLSISDDGEKIVKSKQKEEARYDSLELEDIAKKWGEYLGCELSESNIKTNDTVDGENEIYAVYEDEHGKVVYIFRKGTYDMIFSAEISV